jgi:hypothetical protein
MCDPVTSEESAPAANDSDMSFNCCSALLSSVGKELVGPVPLIKRRQDLMRIIPHFAYHSIASTTQMI